MPTFELNDSSGPTTYNLLGTTYIAQLSTLRGLGDPPIERLITATAITEGELQPRIVTCDLVIVGSSVANLVTQIRNLDLMLATARRRRELDQGTVVVLKVQLGTTDADDISYRVLDGGLGLPDSVINTVLVNGFRVVKAPLRLVVEPLGRLAEVSPTDGTLENEQDGANLNYMDVTSITGPEAGRLRLKIWDTNRGGAGAWAGTKKMWIATRSGERRTDTLFKQNADSGAEVQDPANTVFSFSATAGLATNASAGTSARLRWAPNSLANQPNTGWTAIGYFQWGIAAADLPYGAFRVLARVAFDLTGTTGLADEQVGVGLGYAFGAVSKAPTGGSTVGATGDFEDFDLIAESTWTTRDVGLLIIPPTGVPDGFTEPTLNLRIYVGAFLDGGSWSGVDGQLDVYLDYIQLLPIDEFCAIVDDVDTDDRILIDGQSEPPGIYLLNSSDVVQSFADAVGNRAFRSGPEATRIYVLRDDTGDPTTTQFNVSPDYLPSFAGI